MKALHKTAFVFLLIGGLDLGLAGLGGYLGSNWNVINLIFGSLPWLENLIYLLIGISALILIFKKHKKDYHADNAPIK